MDMYVNMDMYVHMCMYVDMDMYIDMYMYCKDAFSTGVQISVGSKSPLQENL